MHHFYYVAEEYVYSFWILVILHSEVPFLKYGAPQILWSLIPVL